MVIEGRYGRVSRGCGWAVRNGCGADASWRRRRPISRSGRAAPRAPLPLPTSPRPGAAEAVAGVAGRRARKVRAGLSGDSSEAPVRGHWPSAAWALPIGSAGAFCPPRKLCSGAASFRTDEGTAAF